MDRFFAKTRRAENGCLEWIGACKKPSKRRDSSAGGNSGRHGIFWYEGRMHYAHRVRVALETGVPVLELPLISHECDNQKCVDFDHLRHSSPSKNLQEAWDRGRRAPKDVEVEGVPF